VEVRRATAADAPAIGRLLHDFNTEFSEPVPAPEPIAEQVGRLIEGGEAIALLIGEGPDGLAVLRFRPSLYGDVLDAYLEELYVVPDLRGEGRGRALLDAAMEAAREQGATRIELGTGEEDKAARALYESAGFVNRERGGEGPVMLFYERDL
jgi:ribosomal protein S18 acetylase RimI-like enzyme